MIEGQNEEYSLCPLSEAGTLSYILFWRANNATATKKILINNNNSPTGLGSKLSRGIKIKIYMQHLDFLYQMHVLLN